MRTLQASVHSQTINVALWVHQNSASTTYRAWLMKTYLKRSLIRRACRDPNANARTASARRAATSYTGSFAFPARPGYARSMPGVRPGPARVRTRFMHGRCAAGYSAHVARTSMLPLCAPPIRCTCCDENTYMGGAGYAANMVVCCPFVRLCSLER